MNTQLKTLMWNREKFAAVVGLFTTSVSTGKPNMAAWKCVFSNQQLCMCSTSTDIFSLSAARMNLALVAYKQGIAHTLNLCYEFIFICVVNNSALESSMLASVL